MIQDGLEEGFITYATRGKLRVGGGGGDFKTMVMGTRYSPGVVKKEGKRLAASAASAAETPRGTKKPICEGGEEREEEEESLSEGGGGAKKKVKKKRERKKKSCPSQLLVPDTKLLVLWGACRYQSDGIRYDEPCLTHSVSCILPSSLPPFLAVYSVSNLWAPLASHPARFAPDSLSLLPPPLFNELPKEEFGDPYILRTVLTTWWYMASHWDFLNCMST